MNVCNVDETFGGFIEQFSVSIDFTFFQVSLNDRADTRKPCFKISHEIHSEYFLRSDFMLSILTSQLLMRIGSAH